MLSVKSDVVRYCHSDVQLHLSGCTLSQLLYMISFAVKFARLINGENSTEFKTANHWYAQLKSAFSDYEKSFKDNCSVVCVLHTYFD